MMMRSSCMREISEPSLCLWSCCVVTLHHASATCRPDCCLCLHCHCCVPPNCNVTFLNDLSLMFCYSRLFKPICCCKWNGNISLAKLFSIKSSPETWYCTESACVVASFCYPEIGCVPGCQAMSVILWPEGHCCLPHLQPGQMCWHNHSCIDVQVSLCESMMSSIKPCEVLLECNAPD